MHTVLLILALWCVPSILLVAVRVWHVYKANIRVHELHLDAMFAQARHSRGQHALFFVPSLALPRARSCGLLPRQGVVFADPLQQAVVLIFQPAIDAQPVGQQQHDRAPAAADNRARSPGSAAAATAAPRPAGASRRRPIAKDAYACPYPAQAIAWRRKSVPQIREKTLSAMVNAAVNGGKGAFHAAW